MRTHRSAKLTIAVALAAALASGQVKSAPIGTGAPQFKSAADGASVEPVRWRGRGGGGAVIGGLAAGMILGGIIASQPYYYGGPYYYGPAYPPPYYDGPGPYGPPDLDAYCFSRYRSYDPYSGTYMGYDGVRRPCR